MQRWGVPAPVSAGTPAAVRGLSRGLVFYRIWSLQSAAMADIVRSQLVVDPAALAAQCAAAAALSAALVAASSPPAGTPHPHPVVEVLVGSFENSRPPRRRGGPFRIYLRPDVLTGPEDDRRWLVGHETAHVCSGHLDRRITKGAVALVPGLLLGVVAAVGIGITAVRAVGRGQFRLIEPPVAVQWLGLLAVGLMAAAAVLIKRRELPFERAADAYAAGVLGVAMTTQVQDRAQERQDRWPWLAPVFALIRSHPQPAERYASTQAMAAAHPRRSDGSTG